MNLARVSVLGAGTMGGGIAHVCALSGREVRLIDINADVLERARATIQKNLGRQVAKERITEDQAASALSQITTETQIGEGIASADIVIEAAPERADLKYELFRQIDEAAPAGAILASNTSSISITEIAARTDRPESVIGMHFMNPVPIMKLIEVIRGLATSDATTEAVIELSRDLGKTPVEVNDFPGSFRTGS